MEREQIIAALVSAAGGRLTGRVRLQKTVYLLDQLGLRTGFDYEYHHYGPYSSEVTAATEDAKALGLINEKFSYRISDGTQFSIFESAKQDSIPSRLGSLTADRIKGIVGILDSKSSTVLELAATVDWLRRYENVKNWRAEIKQRKGAKTEHGRLDEAVNLLAELGLQVK